MFLLICIVNPYNAISGNDLESIAGPPLFLGKFRSFQQHHVSIPRKLEKKWTTVLCNQTKKRSVFEWQDRHGRDRNAVPW